MGNILSGLVLVNGTDIWITLKSKKLHRIIRKT